MATSTNGGAPNKGQLAKVTYYEREGITIARAAHNDRTKKGNSPAALVNRTKMANLNTNWRELKPFLGDTFEDRKPLANAFNGFCSNNLSRTRVHLTKEQSEGQVAVADHFCVSHGSLPLPVQAERAGDWLRSDLAVAPLPRGQESPLYEFAVALMHANPERLQWGDVVRYVALRQGVDINSGLPVTQASMCQVALDKYFQGPLRAVLDGQMFQQGFSIEQGFLAAPWREGTLSAWIILRPQKKGRPKVTTQCLAGDNRLLGQFTSQEALEKAIESYCPIVPLSS